MIRKTLTTLFADVQGYTYRTGQQTREEHERFIIELRSFIEKRAKEKNGNFVKAMGDGFMLTFESPTDAVACGINIQKQISLKYAAIRKREKPILFRIGISTGEVMVDDTGDVYGEAVNIAARIEAFAIPGEVYISEATYLAMNKSEFNAIDLGPQKFKNVRHEISVYRAFEGNADLITSLQRPISKKQIQTAIGIAVVILIGLSFVFFSQRKSTDGIRSPKSDLHVQFERMLQDKDFDGIIRKAEQILRDDPDRGEVYYFLSKALMQMGDLQRAETYLNKAIEFDPENAGVYNMFSDLYAAREDFDQAISYLAEYLRREHNSEQKNIAIKRMQELESLKQEYYSKPEQLTEKVPAFAEAPEPSQQPASSQYNTLQNEYSIPEKKEDVEPIPVVKPSQKTSFPKKELRKMSRGQLQELRKQLREYMYEKDYDMVRDVLLRAEEENVDNAPFFIFASKLYLTMDDYGKAEEMLMNAIDINPDNPAPYFGLSLVYEEKEDYKASIRMLREVMFRDKNEIRRRKMEGKIKTLQDKIKESESE